MQYNLRKLIFEHKSLKLFHYQNKNIQFECPILIVFATINRPEILDLFPDTSFIRGLLNQGLDVFLLDWGYANSNDNRHQFKNYYLDDLPKVINHILKNYACPKINLIGICQGGVISFCYTLSHRSIANLILISTPIDFHCKKNIVRNLLRCLPESFLQRKEGLISGALITSFFNMVHPFESMAKRYQRFIQNDLQSLDKLNKIDQWLQNSSDQPSIALYDFIRDFYVENSFMQNKFSVNNKKIDLNKIDTPILNIVATRDKIVPPQSSLKLKSLIKHKNYIEQKIPTGHIGIYVNPPFTNKVTKKIATWLQQKGK